MRTLTIAFSLFLLQFPCIAQVKLPSLIRDSMILQRNSKVPVWGWASPKEHITVRLSGKTYLTTADTKGNWKIILPPEDAGGPFTLEIIGKNKIILKDVLFGDVWFCSGQSNMVHQMNIHDIRYAADIATANYPQIRQCWIPTLTSLQGPKEDLPDLHWRSAVGDEVRPFSAVAYFFAKKIHEQYRIPIGIINASVGGTPIEAWISEEGLKDFTTLFNTIQKNKDTSWTNSLNRKAISPVSRPQEPTDLGLTGPLKWFDPAFTPEGWRPINIPGYWEDQGVKDLNGIVWYRREVNIPASMTDRPAKVFLGRIVDADELYINGQKVGNTTYMYPQRRYPVKPGILKEGKNVFVVRVTNHSGKGGFVPDKPYCIFSGKDTVDLKGTWLYKPGLVNNPFGGQPRGGIAAQNQPGALFNAMVAPVINYAIKGFCWYQGEANAGQPQNYYALMQALIRNWRTLWKQEELPFLYVQLPGFMDYNYLPSESNWALIREAQLKTLSVPRTGMAVAIDLGEWNDIHPDNKKDVGERLALQALHLAYGENITSSGPLFQSYKTEGNKLIIQFSQELSTTDGEAPAEFAIAGSDKKFLWAKTKIKGNILIAWNDEISQPRFVRYAWADNPVNPNLINKEGLPASPFRTDN
ncbi:sialate O-acetylesterase [Pseudoflavitalea rhizosphaerae]|uniref:sialate O-acetylesterase n=1 Tax=Pseudoflavitalea rhizosphaerae TaxID=1884793 RepID=UPI000F8F6994|nr:sialate O-acetylesterase [Pseudoflavitalea rhizosphaerae]